MCCGVIGMGVDLVVFVVVFCGVVEVEVEVVESVLLLYVCVGLV